MSVSNTRPPRKIITTHRCVRMTMNAICCFLMILQSKRSTVFRRCDGYVDLCAGTACPRCARRRRTRPRDNWEEPDPDGTIEKQEADDANGLGEYESGHDTPGEAEQGHDDCPHQDPLASIPLLDWLALSILSLAWINSGHLLWSHALYADSSTADPVAK